MLKKIKALALAAVIAASAFIGGPAVASQGACVMPTSGTVSGLTLVQDINTCIDAIFSNYSGATAPVNGTGGVSLTYQWWLKTTDKSLSIYDSTNWLRLGTIDSVNHWWQPPIGGGTATIASATTTDLWSTAASGITISGATTITALASASAVPGTIKKVTFSGALILTHNATSLILQGGVNRTTAAGDTAEVEAITSTNVRVRFAPASGLPVTPLAAIAAHTFLGNITGSSAVPSANTWTAMLDAECGSTQGMLAYRNATVWNCLAVGTSGQLLTSGGAAANISWTTSGSTVMLCTVVASASATIDLQNGVVPSGGTGTCVLDNTYDYYEVVISSVKPANNAVNFVMQVGTGGTPTWVTSGYAWTAIGSTAAASILDGSNSDASIGLNRTGNPLGNAAAKTASYKVLLDDPESTATYFSPRWIGNYNSSADTVPYQMTGAGSNVASGTAITALRFKMSAGNIASGRFTLYGYKKS